MRIKAVALLKGLKVMSSAAPGNSDCHFSVSAQTLLIVGGLSLFMADGQLWWTNLAWQVNRITPVLASDLQHKYVIRYPNHRAYVWIGRVYCNDEQRHRWHSFRKKYFGSAAKVWSAYQQKGCCFGSTFFLYLRLHLNKMWQGCNHLMAHTCSVLGERNTLRLKLMPRDDSPTGNLSYCQTIKCQKYKVRQIIQKINDT